MTYVSFLTSLFEEGRVVVPDDEATAEQMQAGAETIAAYEKAWRSSLPGSPPEMAPSAAKWAAMRFFRACQFTLYRDADAETIEREPNKFSARSTFSSCVTAISSRTPKECCPKPRSSFSTSC